jgi:hypothetical protein
MALKCLSTRQSTATDLEDIKDFLNRIGHPASTRFDVTFFKRLVIGNDIIRSRLCRRADAVCAQFVVGDGICAQHYGYAEWFALVREGDTCDEYEVANVRWASFAPHDSIRARGHGLLLRHGLVITSETEYNDLDAMNVILGAKIADKVAFMKLRASEEMEGDEAMFAVERLKAHSMYMGE